MKFPVAILLLCAGASSRWGEPKALLSWEGGTLGNALARAALDAGPALVVRVLGAHAERIAAVPAPAGVLDVFNENWSAGMGASIACGLRRALLEEPALGGVVVLPCDQPLVGPAVLAALCERVAGRPDALARCDYGGGERGPPAAFGRDYFPDLLTLTGDEGARGLFARHADRAGLVPCPEGRWDLDGPDDLARFRAETRGAGGHDFSR
jgi:molybdenum cofactor cytidylyltransferase